MPSRVVQAEKAKAVKGKEGTASEGEKDAHELLRTLVRIGRPPHTGLPRVLRAASFLLPNTRLLYDGDGRQVPKQSLSSAIGVAGDAVILFYRLEKPGGVTC